MANKSEVIEYQRFQTIVMMFLFLIFGEIITIMLFVDIFFENTFVIYSILAIFIAIGVKLVFHYVAWYRNAAGCVTCKKLKEEIVVLEDAIAKKKVAKKSKKKTTKSRKK